MMGIYSTLSFINHSCRHNAFLRTPPAATAGTEQLIAAKHIAAGEELSITYISFYNKGASPAKKQPKQMAAVLGVHERRQRLQDLYGFVCRCPACRAEALERP